MPCNDVDALFLMSTLYPDASEVPALVEIIPDDRKLHHMVVSDKIIRPGIFIGDPDKIDITCDRYIDVSPRRFVKQQLTVHVIGNVVVFVCRSVYGICYRTLFVDRYEKIIDGLGIAFAV